MHHTDSLIRERWTRSGENEFGRLFQGFSPNGTEGKDVLEWARKQGIPLGKMVAYPRYVAGHRPEKKDEPWRTRITAGGNLLEYFGGAAAHTASMEATKMHWNSVLPTDGAKYCTGDISSMYLESLLPDAEYARFKYDLAPQRVTKCYSQIGRAHV